MLAGNAMSFRCSLSRTELGTLVPAGCTCPGRNG